MGEGLPRLWKDVGNATLRTLSRNRVGSAILWGGEIEQVDFRAFSAIFTQIV